MRYSKLFLPPRWICPETQKNELHILWLLLARQIIVNHFSSVNEQFFGSRTIFAILKKSSKKERHDFCRPILFLTFPEMKGHVHCFPVKKLLLLNLVIFHSHKYRNFLLFSESKKETIYIFNIYYFIQIFIHNIVSLKRVWLLV